MIREAYGFFSGTVGYFVPTTEPSKIVSALTDVALGFANGLSGMFRPPLGRIPNTSSFYDAEVFSDLCNRYTRCQNPSRKKVLKNLIREVERGINNSS